jgi:type IV pilus assembly protein PilC
MAQYGAAAAVVNTTKTITPPPGLFADLFSSSITPRTFKVPQKDLLVFFRQLAVVLQSGVPLSQGLDLLADNMTNKKFSICISRIAARLSAGEELSLCLKQYPKVFAPITIGLIEAGEAGGILDMVLDRIALLMEEQAKIRGQIVGALVYPVLVLVLSLSVSLGLLIFIVPKFKDMFDSMGAELPALTTFMLNLSNFVTSAGFAIGAPVTVFVLLYLFRGFYATKEGKLAVDSALFKIPLFGDLVLRSEMASMCDTLNTLVNSGIPLVDALDRCVTASPNQLIRNTIQRGIVLVEQGQELSYSLSQSTVFPKLVVSMIKIGEETGNLPFMLEKLAIFYKREVEATVSALTKAMEPTVIFVVAGIVGTIVVSLYLPMFSLITNMNK